MEDSSQNNTRHTKAPHYQSRRNLKKNPSSSRSIWESIFLANPVIKQRNPADIITAARIVCSICMLFVPVFSQAFYALYIAAGLCDMIDGTVARKTGTASDLGSRLDTAADFVLVAVCLIKMMPALDIPVWLMIWTAVIALIKVINMISGYVMRKELAAVHTVMNKLTGIALFLLPLTLSVIDLRYSGVFVCILATSAAIQEGHLVRTGTYMNGGR